MAKDDQQEAYEKVLTASLARVIDFTKFAEAKNAALLTFSSAWILASVTISASPQFHDWKTLFSAVIPLFVLSALVAIISFLPRMTLSQFHKDPEQSKSLLYFGDIASFATAAFKERLKERYMPPAGTSATQSYLDDLAVQISVNSCIALRKFRLFRVGAFCAFCGVAIILYPTVTKFLMFLVGLVATTPK